MTEHVGQDNQVLQWQKRSERQQKDFMNNIAQRLGRSRVTEPPAHPFRGAPDFWQRYSLTKDERIALFTENWTLAGGHVLQFEDMASVRKYILDFCQETKASRIVMQEQSELAALALHEGLSSSCSIQTPSTGDDATWKKAAAEADIGLAVVDFAVAYTGSVVVRSDQSKPRSTSLLPKVFMAIVPESAIKTKLGEVMVELEQHQAGRDIPAGIHFISGPSRSADIENDLTIGVHGPGIVHALIVADE